MRLIINTATTFKGGGLQVAYSFIKECENFPEHDYHVILGVGLSKVIKTEDFPSNFHFYRINYRPAQKVFSFSDPAAFLKEVEKKVNPDCVFTTSGPAYWRPKAPHVMGFNLPHYLYKDSPFYKLIPFVERVRWSLKGVVIKYYSKRDADAYVVQTEDVNKRLGNWIGNNKIFTVSNTYGSQYALEKPQKKLLPEKEEGEFRLLILSGYYRHKNLDILNAIANQLRKCSENNIKFILTLPKKDYGNLIDKDYRSRIQNIGPLKPEECPQIYRECDAIFLPTLLECFSATYAEAMKMQLPIITTDLTFAHTVCGNAALYFSPLDSEDAVKKIIKLYKNENLRNALVLQGKEEMKKFMSARRRAEEYLRICEVIKR